MPAQLAQRVSINEYTLCIIKKLAHPSRVVLATLARGLGFNTAKSQLFFPNPIHYRVCKSGNVWSQAQVRIEVRFRHLVI